MAETDAIFGGEHSGHFYFRDFWRADSGMLAALHALAALAETDQPLSRAARRRTSATPPRGEINSDRRRPAAPCSPSSRRDVRRPPTASRSTSSTGSPSRHADWWFNVRASNTEPLLRLNAEGKDEATMARVRDDVLTMIRSRPVNLDPELLEIIVCPDCHGSLAAAGRGARLRRRAA